MEETLTASNFIAQLKTHQSEKEREKLSNFFKGNDGKTKALGIKFGEVFKLAKQFTDMPLTEVDKLLDSGFYEVRMGAVSIMDFQAKNKKTTPEIRKELFELYLDRHDRLNNWDFVDRGAYSIVGDFLVDKPRDILYALAKSEDVWERRTAIVGTYAFIKKGELDDTFKIAEILIKDEHELINKAVGSWIREAGKRDEEMLTQFLDKHAANMPRITLRYAIERLDKSKRQHYLNLR